MKVIVHHLPQFHRVPENDAWWGAGFTEWTHLERWRPAFRGHQIRRPSDPYDLTDPAARRRQGELARQYGIYAFCFYHYWSAGKMLLQKPAELMLRDGEPNVRFCFSWANEPWTRRWDGYDRDVLWPQDYGGVEEWDAHLDYLLPFFRYPTYVRVEDRPVFLVYRLAGVPDQESRFCRWRERLRREGFAGLHLVQTVSRFPGNGVALPGADAVADFFPTVLDRLDWSGRGPIVAKASSACRAAEAWPRLHGRHYRGAGVGWDNTPRRGENGSVLLGFTPELFADHLRRQADRSDEFTFVNAWNEWGEQAVLEPDATHGRAYLEAVARSLP